MRSVVYAGTGEVLESEATRGFGVGDEYDCAWVNHGSNPKAWYRFEVVEVLADTVVVDNPIYQGSLG